MYTDLNGKTAVITGAGSGIGAAIARRYAGEGMNVVINFHDNEAEAIDVCRSLRTEGKNAIHVKADVGDERQIGSLMEEAVVRFGGVDVWVNNAGIQKEYRSHEMPLEIWNRIIDTNLTGVFLGSREAIRHFIATGRKGVIVNISSVHEIIPWARYAAYAASKGGVKLLTRSLALEYAPAGIRINSIAPGATDTPINGDRYSDPELMRRDEQGIPLQYIARPEEMANVAAFLASSQSGYITGATIVADGGLTLYPPADIPDPVGK